LQQRAPRSGKANSIPGHDIVIVLLGCFILALVLIDSACLD
jgi:hypothetical protein